MRKDELRREIRRQKQLFTLAQLEELSQPVIARLRERLGIKFNFEMALLPAEMFAQRGKHLRLIVGKAIPYSTFDSRHTPKEWAQLVQDYCYRLQKEPNASFE